MNPIEAKRNVLEEVLASESAWASKARSHYGIEAGQHLGQARDLLDLFAQTGSPIHLETVQGHLAMALAWRAASGKKALRVVIPEARAWLKGELAEAAKVAQEVANPAAWNEPPDRLDEQETA